MKKTFIWGLLLLLCLSTTVNAFAESGSTNVEETNIRHKMDKENTGFIVVGYDLEDEKEIFGNISQKDIKKEMDNLLNTMSIQYEKAIMSKSLNNLDSLFDNKLTFFINNGQETVEIGGEISGDNISPYRYDDRSIVKNIKFGIKFKSPNGTYYPTANYTTKVNGIITPNNRAAIEKLTTTFTSGSKFPFKDYYYGTKYAKTIYRNLYTLPSGVLTVLSINFQISNGGTITYTTTNPNNDV